MLKYNIKKRLDGMSPTQSAIICGKIYERCNVSKKQFSRWIRIQKNGYQEIRYSALQVIAELLNVQIKDLFND